MTGQHSWRWLTVVAALAGVMCVPACSSGSSGGHSSSHDPTSSAAASVSPTLIATFQHGQSEILAILEGQKGAFNTLPQAVTGRDLAPVLAPVKAGTQKFNATIQSLEWPGTAKSDADALVSTDNAMIDQYDSLTKSTKKQGKVIVLSNLQLQFRKQVTVLNRLRADVGLAPV